MNSPESSSRSLFEAQLKSVEGALENQLGVNIGANLVDNIGALRRLASMNKFMLEAHLSSATIISLNDEEYERLHTKIKVLLSANEEAARQQGIDLN